MYIQVPVRRGLGETFGPFEGTFTGTLNGDGGTSAAVTASFVNRDNAIKGKITLAPGLQLQFGKPCQLEPVDIREIPISTTWDPANPRHAAATTTVEEPTTQFKLVKSINIKITVVADLAADGKTIAASVTLAPQGVAALCGSKTLSLALTRAT